MSIKSKALGLSVRAGGAYIAGAGVRRMNFSPYDEDSETYAQETGSAVRTGLGMYLVGSVVEKLPRIIDPENKSLVGDVIASQITLSAVKRAREGGRVTDEAENYVRLRRYGAFGVRVLKENATTGRVDAIAQLADDVSIVTDVIATDLHREGEVGMGSHFGRVSSFAHSLGTLLVTGTAFLNRAETMHTLEPAA